MNILVTGCNGFIGRNLTEQLKNRGYTSLLLCGSQTTETELLDYLKHCDIIIHLAGVSRPAENSAFMQVHRDFTAHLIRQLELQEKHCPIIAASSIQAESENLYGKSKRVMEDLLTSYSQRTGAAVTIYRLPNVFGKWCRPNYNSVIATFCHQLACGGDIQVFDERRILKLVHIDDVTEEFIKAITSQRAIDSVIFGEIPIEFSVSLKEIAEKLRFFREAREKLVIPSLEDPFDHKLYSTYLTYLPEGQFNYDLEIKQDKRGYFSEALKSPSFGQISISRTKPGVVRGNHWHHIKCEKFLIVEGSALISFRKIGETRITSYPVSGSKPEIIEVPSGYTHSLKNTGDTDMVALIWCSDQFDEKKPDTYFEEV